MEDNYPEYPAPVSGLTYSTVTHNIRVTASPEFFDTTITEEDQTCYMWVYHIQIENLSTQSVQLLKRHWVIIDENGGIQEVKGDGVVGLQPTIAPSDCFEYTSGSYLTTPSGMMMGRYEILTSTGDMLEIDIPTFSLDSPETVIRGH